MTAIAMATVMFAVCRASGNFPAFALQGSVAFTGRQKQFMSTIPAQAPRRSRPRIQFHQLKAAQNNKATARVALLFCLVEPAGIEPASANPPLPVLRV